MTRLTVLVVMANLQESNTPLMVCMTKAAGKRAIKDIKEFLQGAPDVDYRLEGDAWEKSFDRRQRYLKQRPWGFDADGADLSLERVPVRWVP